MASPTTRRHMLGPLGGDCSVGTLLSPWRAASTSASNGRNAVLGVPSSSCDPSSVSSPDSEPSDSSSDWRSPRCSRGRRIPRRFCFSRSSRRERSRPIGWPSSIGRHQVICMTSAKIGASLFMICTTPARRCSSPNGSPALRSVRLAHKVSNADMRVRTSACRCGERTMGRASLRHSSTSASRPSVGSPRRALPARACKLVKGERYSRLTGLQLAEQPLHDELRLVVQLVLMQQGFAPPVPGNAPPRREHNRGDTDPSGRSHRRASACTRAHLLTGRIINVPDPPLRWLAALAALPRRRLDVRGLYIHGIRNTAALLGIVCHDRCHHLEA
mmetsp:Transcript_4615/g.13520  ORF Transcript_4615/g.13520 Transcript_4615/m.13520 type:complete len:330 (-) Transcript_4615:483-1472(-)